MIDVTPLSGVALGVQEVAVEVDRGVAWVTMNRPEAANARNQRMRTDLLSVWAAIADDPDVRCVVLTGAGDRFFCAGMDLKENSGSESLLERRNRLSAGRDIEVLAGLPRPTIAMINGYAMGGGLEMALACDLRVIAEDAVVGMPELEHGLIPGGGATVRLPRLIGPGLAAELIYTGRKLNGHEAVQIGLANRVVCREELRATVDSLAGTIAAKPPSAVQLAKESLRQAADLPLSAGVTQELDKLLMLMNESNPDKS